MYNLSAAALLESNKLESDKPWFVLLKVVMPDSTTIRVVRNTADITWNSQTWTAFNFVIDKIADYENGKIPETTVRVSNVLRALQSSLEATTGGEGSTVTLYVIHEDSPSTAEIEIQFDLISCTVDAQWVTFNLGAKNIYHKMFPKNRMMKRACRWKFQDADTCQYAVGPFTAYDSGTSYVRGDVVTYSSVDYVALQSSTNAQPDLYPLSWAVLGCDKSLSYCELLSNTDRFGGFPSIGRSGLRL